MRANTIPTTALWALALAAISASATPVASRTATGDLGRWQDLGPIALQPRQEHTAVALNATTFALVGGIVPTEGGGGGNSPSDWATTDMFQLFNTETGRWTLGPALPFAVNHANTVVVDDSLYLLGGLTPDADGNWVATGRSYVLDGVSSIGGSGQAHAWRALSPVPAPRGSAAVAHHAGRIYLAGGMLRLIPQDTIGTVAAYDVAADAWLPAGRVPDMPEARDHAGSAAVGGVLYVLGGRREGQNNTRDTVFALDLAAPADWSVRRGRMPTSRGGVAAAAVGTKVYTFGGEGNQAEGSMGVFPDTEVYDVATDTWERLAPMELPRHGSWAVALGDGGVYLPGGGVRQGGAAVDKFDVFWPPKC